MYSNDYVIITGASRGIGKATAIYFAKKNYNLILICNKNIDLLNQTAKELMQNYNIDCIPLQCNISSAKNVDELFDIITKYSDKIKLLINNAGISYTGLLQDLPYEDWERIVSTNISSVFFMCKKIIPIFLRNREGKIINISSVWGTEGASCEVAYSATKGAINSFSKALGKELAPSNIQVNSITFGAIDTEMNDFLSEEEKEDLCMEIPIGRMATPEEAAEFIYHIFKAPAYLTAQVIPFNGGWY